MTQQTDEWEEVEVPAGTFISWSDRPGQVVTGKVLEYGDQDGTDFDGKPCPRLEVELAKAAYSVNKSGDRFEHEAGDVVTLNAGLANLKKGVRAAKLSPGDEVWISFASLEKVPKGQVKVFTVRVRRGAGTVAEEEPPF
jgi:hypothetical protein